jgi:hypothetical protein
LNKRPDETASAAAAGNIANANTYLAEYTRAYNAATVSLATLDHDFRLTDVLTTA